jgi:hypothetical protein
MLARFTFRILGCPLVLANLPTRRCFGRLFCHLTIDKIGYQWLMNYFRNGYANGTALVMRDLAYRWS